MKLLTLIVVFSIVIALCMVGLGISMLLRKNGKFPETEIGSNKNMRKMGITCTKQEEIRRWKKMKRQPLKPTEHDCDSCTGCNILED